MIHETRLETRFRSFGIFRSCYRGRGPDGYHAGLTAAGVHSRHREAMTKFGVLMIAVIGIELVRRVRRLRQRLA
jgi:hypothetical protein